MILFVIRCIVSVDGVYNLFGGQVTEPQQFLHGVQVSASVQQMGRIISLSTCWLFFSRVVTKESTF